MMDSGGDRNSSGDDDRELLSEFRVDHHHHHHQYQAPFEQSSNNHQNYHYISTKIIIRRTIPYLIALAFAAGLLIHHSTSHIDLDRPFSYHPLAENFQNNSTQSSQSSPPSRNYSASVGNLSAVSNFTSETSTPENLPSDTLSAMKATENVTSSPASNEETEEVKLEKVLSKAAMKNKTVIVTTVNAAWSEPGSLLDLLLESFKIGDGTQKLLNHLVVMGLDQKSYNRCLELHSYCYPLKTEGVDFSAHEAFFMSREYMNLVWRKIEVMCSVIKLGYSAIFTDADIVWFRDPFLHFVEDGDMQTASDHYGSSPTDGISNTGFYYVKSNSRTIKFFEFWLASRLKFKDRHDQDVFNMLRTDPALIENIGIKIRLLDTAFYGGFCEPSKDLNLVCVMHANCCKGLGFKLDDLRLLLQDWKNYMELPTSERTKNPYSWTRQRKCVPKNIHKL